MIFGTGAALLDTIVLAIISNYGETGSYGASQQAARPAVNPSAGAGARPAAGYRPNQGVQINVPDFLKKGRDNRR